MSDRLTPEELFEFIDQGGGSGPVGWHLQTCAECLFELDFLLLAEAPATPEEEAFPGLMPEFTARNLLTQRPRGTQRAHHNALRTDCEGEQSWATVVSTERSLRVLSQPKEYHHEVILVPHGEQGVQWLVSGESCWRHGGDVLSYYMCRSKRRTRTRLDACWRIDMTDEKRVSGAREQETNVREMLERPGVIVPDQTNSPWFEASLESLGRMYGQGSAGRTECEKALLSVLMGKLSEDNTTRIEDATRELTKATSDLVEANNNGTQKMASLQSVLIVLTVVIAGAAVADVWVASKSRTPSPEDAVFAPPASPEPARVEEGAHEREPKPALQEDASEEPPPSVEDKLDEEPTPPN